MILYNVIPWIEANELNLGPCRTYAEAREIGNTFYPEGYDIEEFDTEED